MLSSRGRRLVGLLGLGLLAAAVYLGLRREEPAEAPRAAPRPTTKPARRLSALAPPPVAGAPCLLSGAVRGGSLRSVRVHVAAVELDVEGAVLEAGAAYRVELPEQGPLRLTATDAGGTTLTYELSCGGGGRVDLDLVFPADRQGYAELELECVYAETGAAVDGATVRAVLARDQERSAWSAHLAGDGRARARVRPGSYLVRCGKDGDEGEALPLQLVADERRALRLFVLARAGIQGRVVDPAGEGVAFAEVSARTMSAPPRRTRAGADGRFHLAGLALGPATITAQQGGAFAERALILRPGWPEAAVELVLRSTGLTLHGQVQDEEGLGLAGAAVELRDRPGLLRREVLADEDGRFWIAGLVPDQYVLEASHPGYLSLIESRLLAVTTTVTLRLSKGCTPRVEVLPADPRRAVSVEVRGERHGGSARGMTGEVLELPQATGRLELFVRALGPEVRTATGSVEACGPPAQITLERGDGGVIEVSIVDEAGRGVPRAQAWVMPGVGRLRAGEDGRARVEGLPAGRYRVGLVADFDSDFAEKAQELELPAGATAQVELVLERAAGLVMGTVVRGGRPVEAAVIRARCRDGGGPRTLADATIVARSDASGHFEFEPEDGSLCLVRAEHTTEGQSEPVTLRAGALPGRLELEGYAAIAGRVVRVEDRAPVPEYSLIVRSLGRGADVDVRTLFIADPGGAFAVEGLPAGPVSLSVRAGAARAHQEVQLAAGERKTGVELVLFGAGLVTGRVVSAQGPLGGARVSLRALEPGGVESGGSVAAAVTAEDGRFTATVVAGAPLRAFVAADGFYPWGSPPFDLTAAGPADLGEITLQPRGAEREKEGGVGIRFTPDPKGVRVVELTPDSPARDAGVQVGDVITAIDGTPAGRLPMVNWIVLLRGPAGTRVVLELERGGQPPLTVVVVRRAIGLPAVPDEAP